MRVIRLSNGKLLIPIETDDPDAGPELAEEIGPDHPEYARWLLFAEDSESLRRQFRPAAELEGLSRFRRLAIGVCAAIAAIFAALWGSVLNVAAGRVPGWKAAAVMVLGDGLLIVALFLSLVAWRLWFGRRRRLDAAINRLFPKAYLFLVGGVLVLAACAIFLARKP